MVSMSRATARSASTISPCSALSATPPPYGISIGPAASSGRMTKP